MAIEKTGGLAGGGKGEGKAGLDKFWLKVCLEAEKRIDAAGASLRQSLFSTIFPKETGKLGRGLTEDGVEKLRSDGADVILLANYVYPKVGALGNLESAHIFVGSEWRIEINMRSGWAGGPSVRATIRVDRKVPEAARRDPLLSQDGDWVANDPPIPRLPCKVCIDLHEGEAYLTMATYCSGGKPWSPTYTDAAEEAYFSDGRIFWRTRQADGKSISRGGLPSLEAFWPNGTPMVIEFSNKNGEIHRDPTEGPAYQERHPDGSLALEIYAENSRVSQPPGGGFGVRVGRVGEDDSQARVPQLPSRRIKGDANAWRRAPSCHDVLELQWRSCQDEEKVSETVIVGKPDMLLRHSHHQPWRVKKFFIRHPESALHFPDEATWLSSPNCELSHKTSYTAEKEPVLLQASPRTTRFFHTAGGTDNSGRRAQLR
jgi:hypothetical protein